MLSHENTTSVVAVRRPLFFSRRNNGATSAATSRENKRETVSYALRLFSRYIVPGNTLNFRRGPLTPARRYGRRAAAVPLPAPDGATVLRPEVTVSSSRYAPRRINKAGDGDDGGGCVSNPGIIIREVEDAPARSSPRSSQSGVSRNYRASARYRPTPGRESSELSWSDY